METIYDVAVIGGGPGGYVSAIRAAQAGMKTVLIEKDKLGGTCLNRGCIPTKSLLQSAKTFDNAKNAALFGINVGNLSFDYEKIISRKDDVVSKLRRGIEYLVKGNGCTLVSGMAKFVDKNTLEISGTGEKIKFQKAIIATGSYPAMPPIPGIDKAGILNSDTFLDLKKYPSSAVIVGGGVIGIEFATFLNTLGSDVTVVEMMPGILAGIDEEIAMAQQRKLEKRGVKFYLNSKVTGFDKSDSGSVCNFEYESKPMATAADIIIMAAGRRANTADLNLEQIGVKSERGFITVDDSCRTTVDNIYAIGDANGKVMLAHAASHQGIIAAENCAFNASKKADFTLVPSCVYTEPEIAVVGKNEKKAQQEGIQYKVGRFDVSVNGKSMVMGEVEGFIKIISDEKTGEILGMQIYAPHATDMISEATASIKLESTVAELGSTIHPHPTVNEIVMEAAHDSLDHCAHKVKNKRQRSTLYEN